MILPTKKIKSVVRISLEKELLPLIKKSKGKCLDIGSMNAPYKKLLNVKEYLTLDINPKSKPDIIGDVHNIPSKNDAFDTVIATELLEHVKHPDKVVSEIHRILKKNGVCILSTRFAYEYHPGPKDYYRFTQDSLGLLFKDFSDVKIIPHGNRIQLIWSIINVGKIQNLFNLLNPLFGLISFKSKNLPLGFIVYAKK